MGEGHRVVTEMIAKLEESRNKLWNYARSPQDENESRRYYTAVGLDYAVKILKDATKRHTFSELRAEMSPEAQQRSKKLADAMLAFINAAMEGSCRQPPKGWHCTRGAGHSGPCAALPDGYAFTQAEVGQIMNALEGWDGKLPEHDQADRRAAFEMIQEKAESV